MNAEQLQPTEKQLSSAEVENSTAPEAGLTGTSVEELFQLRQDGLKAIKQWVSLKFYYRTAEKIREEEAALRRLLDLETTKQSVLAEYSFVLDPLYFEQKFLS